MIEHGDDRSGIDAKPRTDAFSGHSPLIKRSAKSTAHEPADTRSDFHSTTSTTDNYPLHPLPQIHIVTMGGVSVKDVDAQKFINAYAAFLKRQGKLPMYVYPRTRAFAA